MAGLLLIMEFKNWTVDEAVDAYILLPINFVGFMHVLFGNPFLNNNLTWAIWLFVTLNG